MKKRNIFGMAMSIIMMLAITLMPACTGESNQPTGTVEFRATDAPATGVSKIMVTARNIQIHKADAPEDSWITVVSQEKTFDLVAIEGAEVFLGSENVSSGNYTQIRLDVTKVIVTLDGKDITAKLPSDKLKIVRPWEVKAGQKTILTLDFDAEKFVVLTGNNQAQVKPVIKLEISQGERPLKKLTPDITAPTVTMTINTNGATDVPINTKVGIFFSEAMDPSTINNTNFTLKRGTTLVTGTVTYIGTTATFTPAANFANSTVYTATITTEAKDMAGNPLAVNKVWTFTTAPASGGGGDEDTIAPTVSSTIPANAATGVAIKSNISSTFSEAMNPLTVTTATFTLKQGATPVPGTVTYSSTTATFTPAADLALSTVYTTTITTGAKDLAGNSLTANKVWTFTTGAAPDITAANPTAPVLGETARFVILASQKVTTIGITAISGGDIGIEDQARTYYEGFTAGAAPGQFIELTNGLSYAHDDTDPALIPAPYASTIAFIDQVRTDLGIAYSFLAADPNPSAPTQACPANLGGLTLTRGVYKSAVGVTIPTALHLDAQGDPNSVWIFTIDGDLTTGATGSIYLDNGAQPKNVYWRVGGVTAIASGSTFYGNVFSWAQINVLDGVQITGRLFSVNEQVTLIGDTVTKAQ
ncbi:ice-binding family protein [Chloroflexota bacterium]